MNLFSLFPLQMFTIYTTHVKHICPSTTNTSQNSPKINICIRFLLFLTFYRSEDQHHPLNQSSQRTRMFLARFCLAVLGLSGRRKPAGLSNSFTCGPETGATLPRPRAVFPRTNSSASIGVMAFEESWGRKARFQPLSYFLASVDPHVRYIPLRKAAVKA